MKRPWQFLVMIGLVAVVAAGVAFWRKSQPTAVSYRVVTVKRGDLNITIQATGTVAPENRLEIKPPIAGRIEQVLVKEGQKVKRGQILAWMSSTERATLLDAARAQGPNEVKRWEELYRPTPVVAPLNGTIILRSVEPGQTFTTNDSILSMSDRLTVKAQVDETDIAQVKVGQSARIVLDAYPAQGFDAKVDKIAYDATTVNNVTNYIVDVLPVKTPDFMRSGMTANVNFLVNEKKQVLLIPTEALMAQNGATTVMVRENGQPVSRKIEVGASDGRRTEVVSGLKEGDQVLVTRLNLQGSDMGTNPFSPFHHRGGGKKPGGH